ncbi:MAG: carboxypeptidase-like regulatory domain-containing protein [Chloroflexota bacterium]
MRRILRLTSAILAIAAIIGWVSPAQAAGEGVISGQVVNKTANGSSVSAVEVSLTVYFNGKVTSDEQKATTGGNGKFEFKGLSTDNGTAYTVSAIFQDASYTSKEFTLTPTSLSQAVELDVYDSTTSDENIQVSNGHIVVYVEHGDLEVKEIWRFSNIGDKTFIGTQGKTSGTLRFTLPSGATSLSPGPGSAIKMTGTGAVSTMTVPPGVTDINFSYFIPYQGSSMMILRKTDYPIASFSLLVQDTGVKVTSVAMTPASPQMMDGTNFLYFTANNLARDIELDASLSGIVNPSAASPSAPFPWPWLLAGGAMLGLMVTVAYSQMKKKQTTTDSPASQPAPLAISSGQSDEDALLMELARLDDAYEAGTIDEKKYRALRAQIKTSLIEVYARSREP